MDKKSHIYAQLVNNGEVKLKEVSRTISKKSLLNEHQTHKHLYNFQATVFIYLLLPFHFISSRVLLSFWIFDLVP